MRGVQGCHLLIGKQYGCSGVSLPETYTRSHCAILIPAILPAYPSYINNAKLTIILTRVTVISGVYLRL